MKNKYVDVRWQKKEAEVLASRNWTCDECATTEERLFVRHGGHKDPWDYPNESMHVLCELCLEDRQDLIEDTNTNIGFLKQNQLKQLFDVSCRLRAQK